MSTTAALVALTTFLLLVLAGWAVERWLDRRLDGDARRALAEARQPAMPGAEGLEIVAQARRGPVILGLGLVVACWVIGFGGALVLAVRAEWVDTGSAAGTLGLGLAAAATWLLGLAALSLYAVAGAHRFAFHDRALLVVTWRGRRRYAWADVRRASLSTWRQSTSLVLAFDGLRIVEVPLDDFVQPEVLLRDIERRLPVPVAGATAIRWR